MSAAVPVIHVGAARALELAAARAWFADAGAGPDTPEFELLGDVAVPRLGRFRARGGLERHPNGSQALVEAALAQLDVDRRRILARLARPLIVVVPPGFRPHCWHLQPGVRLEQSGSVRRYALLPADATLGAIVHELGHLLFRWPDLERDTGLGRECVMARGALLHPPAPVNAVLRARAGWLEPRPAARGMPTRELAPGEAVAIGDRVIERRRDPDRLLVLRDRPRPALLRRIELRATDLDRPLLAVARFGSAPIGSAPKGW